MNKTTIKQRFVTVRIVGEDRIQIVEDVIDFISSTSGRESNYTDAINWLLKQFDLDKISS